MKLIILLPAFNEASTIGMVLKSLKEPIQGIREQQVIVINDGSSDETARIAREAGAMVLTHQINRGVGRATITGLLAGKELEADIVVTMDSDGQHDPADIQKLIEPIINQEADLVIGSRLLNPSGMPIVRQWINRGANLMIQAVWGIKTSDSQSGFRAYNRHALNKLSLSTSGYEVCTEILVAAKRTGLSLKEVPIKVIYSEYSRKKGQSLSNALNIVFKLMMKAITG